MTDSATMRCEEFLESYSEYCDGELPAERMAAFDRHLRSCARCRRYRDVLDRGLALWRSLPGTSTSPDFLPRLQHRLYHLDDAGKLSPRQHLGSAALVAVASVGFLAMSWLSFATSVSVEVELPPMAVEVPAAVATDQQRGLFDEGPHLRRSSRFALPSYPTLDEPSGLFTVTSYWTSYGDTASVARPAGQLDEGR